MKNLLGLLKNTVLGVLSLLWRVLTNLLALFVGRFSWTAPDWLQRLNRYQQSNAERFGAIIGLVMLIGVSSYGVYCYYQGLPKPVLIKASITTPGISPNRDVLKPQPLVIDFIYDLESVNPERLPPQGRPSAARIDQVGKVIKSGVRLLPERAGEWRWEGDHRIIFTPKHAWPADQRYDVSFAPSMFVAEARFKSLEYEFATPAFEAAVKELSFYQDPSNKKIRRIVATLSFTHPVDEESLKQQLTLQMRPSGSDMAVIPVSYDYQLSFDKHHREAYVQSVPIDLPKKENYLHMAVSKGVQAADGQGESQTMLAQKVLIPDVYSFLKVNSAATQIIKNQQGEPEQVVSLQFTDDINEAEIKAKVKAYLLPKNRNGRYSWRTRQVNAGVLKRSKPIAMNWVPNQEPFAKAYSFRMDVPEGRVIYMAVERGLKSINDFVLSKKFDKASSVPRYPREVNIMGDGSLLSLSGDKTLSFMARGLTGLKVRLGKLLPGQLNHLITQSRGDIKSPYFNYAFNEKNIVEFNEEILPLSSQHPKKANYASLDLSKYLNDTNLGGFFLEVQGWDVKKNRASTSVKDKRLILITDLGVVVKHNNDTSQDVFVVSVRNGKPVQGAKVELLGRNGLPVFTGKTDAQGHVRFSATHGLKDEKQATVYTVSKAGDVAFIPYSRSTRQINYSKFDVGGVRQQSGSKAQLSAYLFSDRGIYRPGETVNIAAIVKQSNFKVKAGTPLEFQISGPRGNRLLKERLSLPEKGFFEKTMKTEAVSDTGSYQASVYLVDKRGHRRQQLGNTSFRVEEFQPDTLKITTQVAPAVGVGWVSSKQLEGVVNLTNLFGTPAQDRKVRASMQLAPTSFHFKRFPDYQFVDPLYDGRVNRNTVTEALADSKTNADGKARFALPLSKFDQGTYNLRFMAEGFEQGGGRSVTARSSLLVSPLAVIVGYKADGDLGYLRRDQERNVSLIAINNTLKQQALEDLVLRKIEKRPVSSLVQQRNGRFKYQTVIKEYQLSEAPFSVSEQGSTYRLATNKPGNYELVLVNKAGKLVTRIAYQVVGEGNMLGQLEKNAELSLKLDRKDYKAGQFIEMNITAPYTGSGLITIESNKVHAYQWFHTTSTSSIQKIRIPKQLEGNAYVNVVFVRAANSKEVFSSPLSYAVQSFSIDRSKRMVDVELSVPELVRPGKTMEIAYKTDKPSRIVIFAVDEGILQVAKYKTPEPLNHFLRKRALEVRSFQMLDLILPEYNVLREAAGIGGGYGKRKLLGANLNPFARTVDKPAVFWSGIVDADSQTKSVSFEVPDTFSGSLKVMAVAVSDDAMGAESTDTIVRGPFVLSPNVLTVVAPGDEFEVTLGVANGIKGSGKNASVEVFAETSNQLQIQGASKLQLSISEGGEAKASFKVKALDVLGEAKITFYARHKNEQSRRSASLSVRPVQPYFTNIISGYSKAAKVKIKLRSPLYPQLAQQQASASNSPLVLVKGLTDYLEHYPHGCTEQVVSQVFPWIGLVAHSAYAPQLNDARKKFQVLIDRLRSRQLPSGGFMLWPGNHKVADFPSVYVMHFLIEARELGYGVPNDIYRNGLSYLREVARRDAHGWYEARIRANAIYLLSRSGEVTTNYLVDLQGALQKAYPDTWRKDLAALYMAATYQLLQKENVARDLIAHYALGQGSQREQSDYHQPLTMDAQYIYLLSKHFPKEFSSLEGNEVMKLLEPIFKGQHNTIGSAYAVLALSAYSGRSDQVFGPDQVTFSSEDKDHQLTPLVTRADKVFPTVEFDVLAEQLALKAEHPTFYLASQSGFDRQLAAKAMRDNLEIIRDYVDDSGKEVTSIEQGKELTVRLRIRTLNGESRSNVAAIDLLPGGFEVIRSSVPRTAYGWAADYVDVREDRVVFYGQFGSSITELNYRIKATAAGDFTVPPAFAEAMYDSRVKARSLPGRFKVTRSE